MRTYKYLITCTLFVAATACSSSKTPQNTPTSWYELPEDQESSLVHLTQKTETQPEVLAQSMTHILHLSESAVAHAVPNPTTTTTPTTSNELPWRMEYFMTDLSLSAQGLLGFLTFKGTPTVRFYWRHQNPVAIETPETAQLEADASVPSIHINEATQDEILRQEVEPLVAVAKALGQVQDERAAEELRLNLLRKAHEFSALTSVLSQTTTDSPWFPTRFRLDVSADISGKLAPLGTVGNDMRFRFEWHRIMKRSAQKKSATPAAVVTMTPAQSSLLALTQAVATDLEALAVTPINSGFDPYQVRFGVGLNASGEIGLVRTAGSVTGQIYFNRDVSRPAIRPLPKPDPKLASSLALIEDHPTQKHLLYADTHGIAHQHMVDADQETYQMDREAFRQGLAQARDLGFFFAEKTKSIGDSGWRVYEMRTAFDLSISGKLGLATVAGLGTAQISFFNRDF